MSEGGRIARAAIACAMAVVMLAGCVSSPMRTSETAVNETQSVTHLAFTDTDLEELLTSTHAGGLIYVWSPHMPYSVKGLREIHRTGQRMGLTVTPLLDPQADATLSASVIKKEKLAHAALRYLHSTTLFERGATLHFPSLLVFAHGRIGPQMLPGYTAPNVVEAFVRNQLGKVLTQRSAKLARLAVRTLDGERTARHP